MSTLHVHRFGPVTGPPLLALHGLTGHGRRWADLANRLLPDIRVIAPDLRGHGHSTALPPWDLETIVADLVALLTTEADGPVPVVAHSFGGACALRLAELRPDLVRGLVLLDPAVALDPAWLHAIALATLDSPDYTDAEEARRDKLATGWGAADPDLLQAELDDHLVPARDGRVGWRVSLPALIAYWSQLAREPALPPPGMPTVLVRATKVDPPFLPEPVQAVLAERLGANLTIEEWDCEHMVSQILPEQTAALIRAALEDRDGHQ
ncbi:alpha/beta fold hydrolase [Nocardia flavorosea]|uniref:Alpha/beta hydrolase n=1 Tax=Nocardia flavorosea TaxID=53429 RepID=A0A846YBZ9_9NOCA|nr:alpha/beta fold hydrolase [Nocardia flavorosea]NKY55302.1 alpha/beta hydrolase [Nocardia flavorosea]